MNIFEIRRKPMGKWKFGLIGVLIGLLVLCNIAAVSAAEFGVVWCGKSGMTTRVVEGFDKGMSEFAPGIKVEYQKELVTMEELAQVVKRFQKEKTGMAVLRSNGAQWLASNQPTIPTFIGGCNNPVELGLVKDLKKPTGNITGVTYYLPVETQFETFQAIFPHIKSVLLLVEKDNPSSLIDQNETKSYCSKAGIEYFEQICGSKEQAIAAVNSKKDKVSVIIIGNQAIVIDDAAAIVSAAGNTPVLSYSSKPVSEGAIGGFVADDVQLGYMLAQSVAEVLIKGKNIVEVPIKVDPKPKFVVNTVTAQKLGVKIPYEILQFATLIEK
jgi:putative tryptophan/tyrosine transport system substrate-binding protein